MTWSVLVAFFRLWAAREPGVSAKAQPECVFATSEPRTHCVRRPVNSRDSPRVVAFRAGFGTGRTRVCGRLGRWSPASSPKLFTNSPSSEANMKEKREKKGKRSPSDDRAAVKGSSSGAP